MPVCIFLFILACLPLDMDTEFWKICEPTEEEKKKEYVMGYNKTDKFKPYFFSRGSNVLLPQIFTNSRQSCVFSSKSSAYSNVFIDTSKLFLSPELVVAISMEKQCEILGNEEAPVFYMKVSYAFDL